MTIPDLDVTPLAASDAPAVAAMTFPSYRHLLALQPAPRHPELGEVRPVQPFGFVARRQGRAIGLALAEVPLPDAAGAAQLLSVFVLPEARRQGIAGRLVAAVEEEAERRGHRRLEAVYTTGKPAVTWIEGLLAARGWEAPRPGSLVARFAPRDALASPRFQPHLLRGYQRGLEVFPWSQLGTDELAEIRRRDAERRWIEPPLAPWQYDPAELDPSSVGGRHDGRVVGWVLNHRIAPDTVRWSISYMHPELARRGKILALYHATLSLLAAEGSCRTCTFTTPYSYGPMAAMTRRWIAPFARSLTESRLTGRTLGGAATGHDDAERGEDPPPPASAARPIDRGGQAVLR